MKIPKRVLSTILTFVLIFMSVGGVGYIGYSVLFGGGHTDEAMVNSTNGQVTQVASSSYGATNNMPMANTMPMANAMPMESTTNPQTQPASGQQAADASALGQTPVNNQQVAYNPDAIKQSAVILQSKQNLTNAIAKINDAITAMTLDPYSSKTEDEDAMMGNAQSDTQKTSNGSEQASNQPAETIMQNMGSKYDVEKMTQLHTGLYKITIGKVLLDQLNNELAVQADLAYKNTLSPLQFYVNQYNLTAQYTTKLNQAFAYINEAVNLVNINPYVQSDGTANDSVRMENIHQSVYKLAEGVAALRILGDEFTTQAVNLSGMVQAANVNAAAVTQPAQPSQAGTQAANHNAQTAVTANHNAQAAVTANQAIPANLISGLNVSGVVNVLLIVFVAGLILGIIGFIISQIKNQAKERMNA